MQNLQRLKISQLSPGRRDQKNPDPHTRFVSTRFEDQIHLTNLGKSLESSRIPLAPLNLVAFV